MIRETTNPKYFQRPLVAAGACLYNVPDADFDENLGVGAASRSMARGIETDTQSVDRMPKQAPIYNPEPEPEPEPRTRPTGCSLMLFDEAHDAPLWQIIDRTTGVVFARVRGSLMWVVDQIKLAAGQLGGLETDLYYRREA